MWNKHKKKLAILAAILAVVLALLAALGTFYTEYLWFEHLGFDSVFMTMLLSKIGAGVVFGLFALLVLGVHIVLIKRFSKPRDDWSFPTATGEVIDLKETVRKVSTPVVILAALVAATAMGYWAAMHWEELLKYLNRTPFDRAEPILNKDIGFYLFVLPSLQFVQQWLVYLAGLCLVFSAAVYFLRNSILVKDSRYLEMPRRVQQHLLFALATVFVVIAFGWWIEMFETLFSKRGIAYGATYTDVHVNLVAYRIMIGVFIAAALVLAFWIVRPLEGKRVTNFPAITTLVLVGLYAIGTFAWPTVVQKFVVNPNELEKEKPYLEHVISHTRAAYGLDKIQVEEFPATDDLDWAALDENRGTIDNIKIWDHRPIKATYRQVQAIRLYYDFPTVSEDRYWADDAYWQVMLAAREMQVDQLPTDSQTWVNRHLQYTHGYGVCLSPVKRVVGEGLPDLWIKDVPPKSRYDHMAISRPEIYYGQTTGDYVMVNTEAQEFDYPKGDQNVYTKYAGEGGVGIGSFFRRLLFAIRMQDVNMIFTRYLTEESRIMFNRSIQPRVAAVAPFLMLDQETYLVVAGGRLFWFQDAYTISYRYPYSQPTSLGRRARINYLRNSVKVVVDAYDGKMQFYVWDDADPMVKTYAKMFPALFKPASEMPEVLRAHVRYPKDLFSVQAVSYERFHMTDPRVFYNQEDMWHISRELAEKAAGRQQEQVGTPGVSAQQVTKSATRMGPYYMIMKLPKHEREEFLLMLPFTPKDKSNMVAWMTGRCDGDNYGKLLVYTFPKEKLIFGPMQIEARIDQDEHISQWITLRNQIGSKVIRGDLMVIPIDDSILYVEPIYLQSTATQLPELKQVIVSFGKRLTMRSTLTEALYEVFGVREGTEVAKGPPDLVRWPEPGAQPGAIVGTEIRSVKKLVEQAQGHLDTAKRKVSGGDWAAYGAEQEKLKKVLDDLARKLEQQLSPGTQPQGTAPDQAAPPADTPAQPPKLPVPEGDAPAE